MSHGSRGRAWIALTFDDGWNPGHCRAVFDTLEATATPATFFPIAQWVRSDPGLWRDIAAAGFPIGNHTYDHRTLTRLGYAAQYSEIQRAEVAVEAITGRPMIHVLRPPGGAWNDTTLQAAGAAGFPVVLNWDTTLADSSRRRNGQLWPLASYLRSVERGAKGSVILGHCGSAVDVAILREVITFYRARGYAFVTVPEILGLPGADAMTFPAATPRPAPAAGSTSPTARGPVPRPGVPL